MEWFREDGHLTDEALDALAGGEELSELERLELSEHLSFCDLCLERYAGRLTDETLLTPSQPCQTALWRRIRVRALRLLTGRYATAAAAVALVLISVWGAPTPDRSGGSDNPPLAVAERLEEWPQWLGERVNGAAAQLSEWFNIIGGGQNGLTWSEGGNDNETKK